MAGNNKNVCVIDSSYLLAYLLPDETNPQVQETFELYKAGSIRLISSPLLSFEVSNGMYAATLSKRISRISAKKLVESFLKLPITYEAVDTLQALELSFKYKISVYDASYLLLARQKNIPLLTLDKQLKKLR